MVRLTPAALDVNALLRRVRDPRCGALACFLGVVRADRIAGGRVKTVTYEAYRPMAAKALARIGAELRGHGARRWAIAHRTGKLRVGEVSVAVAVSAPHRGEAFRACRHAIERIKRLAPIWKLETAASGRRRWVPGRPLEGRKR